MPSAGTPDEVTLAGRGAVVTVVAQTVARAATIVVVLGSTAIVTRTLSISHYADWVTVLSLMAMSGVLLDPALSPVLVRRLLQDPAGSPRPGTVLRVRLGLAAVAVVLVIGLAALARGADAALLAAVIASQLVPRAVSMNSGAYLQADQRLHRQTVLEALAAALALAGVGLTAALDAPAVVIGLAAYPGPGLVLMAFMLRELGRTPSARLPPPGPDADRMRSVIREVTPLAGALLIGALYARVDVLFVNAAVGERTVASYLFAFQFAEQLLVFGAIIASAAIPLLAARGASRLLEDVSVQEMLVALTATGTLLTAVTIVASDPFVSLIGGPGLSGATRSLVLLAPLAAVLLLATTLGSAYIAEGRGGAYLRFNVAAFAFNVIGNAALTLPFGVGAAARLTWGTELVAAGLAAAPLAHAGRRTALRLAGLIAIAVAASEVAAAGASHVVTALATVAVVLALAAGPMRRVALAARRT